MKKIIYILLFYIPCCCLAQSNNLSDSIRCYAKMNFIIENKSLINSYIKELDNDAESIIMECAQRIDRWQKILSDSALELEIAFMREIEEDVKMKIEKYNIAKLYVIENKTDKIGWLIDENKQLQEYYKNMDYNTLDLTIRKDFDKYRREKIPFDAKILKGLNRYLDSIFRDGESIDTTKSYWAVLFSDSFYDYKSVIIYNHYELRYAATFATKLEIVFLFDEQNRIKMVNLGLLLGL